MSENKGLDIFGIKPVANAIDKTVQKSLEGIEGFLQLTCKPALGEVGLLIQDKVRHWRLCNVIRMLEKAQGKLDFNNDTFQLKSHPRVGLSIIENSSLIDNEEVQDMWAGLFASSCTESGTDDENLIFIDLLKQLTTAQAQILKYGVENSRKIIYPNGLVIAEELKIHCDDIFKLTGLNNYHRVDRELDYLRALGLISSYSGGFDPDSADLVADIHPTYLSLSLYVKSQGSKLDPDEFWKQELITKEQLDKEEEEKAKQEAERRKKENKKL
ncbi:Abi-alpha family protein [Bizionia paragorgiae]|uniref:DUF4393 domain-containing protein n=1 Tax=Bizionia paragorgiae TaxID=283786 RepID=A0A1H4B8N6_BIZPA|nr:Abi-alpha family protein [Bizionia paragorgiae]SEA44192.1 protein of unknown function [Bizionia paragorgiae]